MAKERIKVTIVDRHIALLFISLSTYIQKHITLVLIEIMTPSKEVVCCTTTNTNNSVD